jgi:hypothetical protein
MTTAAASGWAWTPLPWAIRAAEASVRRWGLAATRAMARTADERAAVDAAVEMIGNRNKPCGRREEESDSPRKLTANLTASG